MAAPTSIFERTVLSSHSRAVPLCNMSTESNDLHGLIRRLSAAVSGANSDALIDQDMSRLNLLCARVMSGASEDHFSSLHREGVDRRPLAFVMGADGIEIFLSGNKSALAHLRSLGFGDSGMRSTLKNGRKFRLCLFPAQTARQATWAGVLEIATQTFPSVAEKVSVHSSALEQTPYAEIEAMAMKEFTRNETLLSIKERGPCDERYITTERLEKLEGTLAEVRCWLYLCIGLNELFDGGGYTRRPDGSRGLAEYLMQNRRVSEFEAYGAVPLDVSELLHSAAEEERCEPKKE